MAQIVIIVDFVNLPQGHRRSRRPAAYHCHIAPCHIDHHNVNMFYVYLADFGMAKVDSPNCSEYGIVEDVYRTVIEYKRIEALLIKIIILILLTF